MSLVLTKSDYFSWVQEIAKGVLTNGYYRAAMYATLSGLSAYAGKKAQKNADKLKAGEKVYRDLARQMREKFARQEKDLRGQAQLQLVEKRAKSVAKSAVSSLQSAGFPCVTGKAGSLPRMDSECRCRQTNSCRKAKVPKVDFPEFDRQGVLGKTGAILKGMADNTYRGNFRAASVYAGRLEKQAAGIVKLKGRAVGMLNRQRAREGHKAVDFARLEKKTAAKLAGAVQSGYAKLPASQQKRFASLGLSPGKGGLRRTFRGGGANLSHSTRQPVKVLREIYVAAGDDHAHAFALQRGFLPEQRRHGHGAGRFDHQFHAFVDETHGRDDFPFFHHKESGQMVAQDR